MSKRRKGSRSIKKLLRKPSYELLRQIESALTLHDNGESVAAQAELMALLEEYPDSPKIYSALIDVSADMGDWLSLAVYTEKLLPHERGYERANLISNIAYAYTQIDYPALAWECARILQSRYPNHPNTENARSLAIGIEAFLLEEAKQMAEIAELPDKQKLAVMVQHERVKFHLESKNLDLCVETAEAALAKMPAIPPILNNLSLAKFMLGRVDEAVNHTRSVLDQAPNNFHALANLVRFLVLAGQFEEAEMYAQQLKEVESDDSDLAIKQAEAFSYLGDDEEVWAAYERRNIVEGNPKNSLLFHLAATAAYRLGNTKQAWQLWHEATKHPPIASMATLCLHERTLPIGERSVPWYWPFSYWFDNDAADVIGSLLDVDEKDKEATILQAYYEKRPYFRQLFPHALKYGDRMTRSFILLFIKGAQIPELIPILHEFCLSQIGKDEERIKAAQFLGQHYPHMLPADKQVPLWINGEQKELLIFTAEINFEPQVPEGLEEIVEEMHQAYELIDEEKFDEAERLLHTLIEAAPDFPSLYNHLGVIYERQGRWEKFESLLAEMNDRFPDYFFIKVTSANLHIENNELEEARKLLNSLMTRQQMHIAEFTALAEAEMALAVADNNHDVAQSWLDIWAQIEPDAPQLEKWESHLAQPALQVKSIAKNIRRMLNKRLVK